MRLPRSHSDQYIYHTPDIGPSSPVIPVPRKRTALPGIVIPSSTRLCPGTTEKGSYGLQDNNLYSAEYSVQVASYDMHDKDDVNYVPSYVTDIYQRLYSEEVSAK
jgi:hypothetical protein